MRVLVLHSHPVESSYGAALYRQTVASLEAAGHTVDGCDLYAEKFDPVLSRHDRLIYHDYPQNTELVEPYVERLRQAEGLVIVTPVWNFGFPAMLKGYFDRVWLPGVSFELVDGQVQSRLRHIRKLAAVLTYGATPLRALVAGNPPKKIVKRVLRAQINPVKPVTFLAHYDMNNCTEQTRAAFMARVKTAMERF
ncbi:MULTISPECIES: NAD(P)H-dependent oxidoreductase [unclassified Rhizobium]|uniref:NAD(P)H-dependent oxidoreductase n=1 Tax=unclassified Rhizobium TaxID=2613769 RepID=UPI001ADCC4A0|nr:MULTISPECIES: NAD(P)H-dependent oxidoreductase [unclassified Rhizobium]MBO9100472.1 NAD(P)H-dependent oxidoreductase [Rhizobium sp. L58/93]MBO9136166.1 NAD(P)H-dependent oxidoreductase [Rhizobium sp. B209b/85]MBO9171477.1 NAD(P)H-dependent oxidoreductase [Rhizobium sp. L245/93]MBO9187344.1 NAD(P)H-dependent oxidoreductase [Rhizobium sp. E27B/91]QXZ88015.1 NAD(P)H-dependent oxidoreductase [Rhizobium sp. K1/93]